MINFGVGGNSSFIQRHHRSAHIRVIEGTFGKIRPAIVGNCRVIRADGPDISLLASERSRYYRKSPLTDVLFSSISYRLGLNSDLPIQRAANLSWLNDKQRLYDL